MSKLSEIYQSAKRHTGKIVAGAVIIGALAGMRGCAKNMGEEVYRGNINEQEVVYSEGLFSRGLPGDANFLIGRKNLMTIVDGETKYTFVDKMNETDIDWRKDTAPEYQKDELERIIIKKNGSVNSYSPKGKMSNWNPSTIDGRRSREIFKKGNQMYNNLRAQIREQLRAQYEAQPNPL